MSTDGLQTTIDWPYTDLKLTTDYMLMYYRLATDYYRMDTHWLQTTKTTTDYYRLLSDYYRLLQNSLHVMVVYTIPTFVLVKCTITLSKLKLTTGIYVQHKKQNVYSFSIWLG